MIIARFLFFYGITRTQQSWSHSKHSINSLLKEPMNKGKTVHLDIQPPTTERTVLNSQLGQQMMRLFKEQL